MDAQSLRIQSLADLEGMSEVLIGLHSESPPEIQRIVEIIGALVTAAKPPFNPNALRGPLSHLLNAIGECEAMMIFSVPRMQILCFARAFAAVALTRVDMRAPPPGAVAVPAGVVANDAGRVQQAPPSARVAHLAVRRPFVKVEEPDAPDDYPQPAAVAAAAPAVKRRKTLPAKFADAIVVKSEDVAMKKCDDCGHDVVDDEVDQLRHAWDKHKDQVHKYRLRADVLCPDAACDYIGATEKTSKLHRWALHNNPDRKIFQMPELEAGNCTYCNVNVASLAALKNHLMRECKKRNERPMLGCSGCNRTFHFIYDFCAHLKKVKNRMHGHPVMLGHE